MVDLWLVAALGFLGSFGHCVGMCGPLAVAFGLGKPSGSNQSWQHPLSFHLLLNLGRIGSYALVGGAIGAMGSVLVAGGQLAGIDSGVRRGMAIATGLLLIWLGLSNLAPGYLPKLPFLHPLLSGKLHERLLAAMSRVSQQTGWWTPMLLGMVWGLIPCGFLYAAQIKAAEVGNIWQGMVTLLAFGAGTLPAMVGVGVSSGLMSRDRRHQLFRLGGWVTLLIGIATLFRSDAMNDLSGHASLLLLMLALLARPMGRLWAAPLRYRRGLGVAAFVLAIAHSLHQLDHTFNWQWQAVGFMLPNHQLGVWLGVLALGLLLPAALTSFDGWVQRLGRYWRWLHLLTLPALVLITLHAILIGSSYLGGLQWSTPQKLLSVGLVTSVMLVLLIRHRWVWQIIGLESFYMPPGKPSAIAPDQI